MQPELPLSATHSRPRYVAQAAEAETAMSRALILLNAAWEEVSRCTGYCHADTLAGKIDEARDAVRAARREVFEPELRM